METLSPIEIRLHSPAFDVAMHSAFVSAAERAKQTNTYLVMMENDQIKKIPASEIDAYLNAIIVTTSSHG